MTKIIQEKYIIVLLLYISIFNLHSQELLKEVSKTFDNGQPMFIDYLEIENLKKVKTELFNEKGTLVFSIKFNKETGLPDGEFYDLINKGYFENGELNCENCMLVEANSPSVYTYNNERMNTEITVGDVVKGRLVGEVKKYEQSEETYNKVDWNSTRRYVAAGAGIGFRDVKTYTTGKFTKTLVDTKVYNNNGVLNGTVNLTYTVGRYSEELKLNARLNIKNGIIKSLVSYDEKGVQRDSVSNDQKIWKVNYKYVKNNGFLVFENPDKNNFSGLYFMTTSPLIFLGGMQNYKYSEFSPCIDEYNKTYNSFFDTGGIKRGLDNNGLYTSYLNTGINYIKTIEKHPSHNNIGLQKGVYTGSRIKFLSRVYNYILNDRLDENKPLDRNDINNEYYGYNIEIFYSELTQKYEYNYFKKYLINQKLKKNDISNFNLKEVNDNIISLSDYLKSIDEILASDSNEIQEIWILNKKAKKYIKINFNKLIQLAEKININPKDNPKDYLFKTTLIDIPFNVNLRSEPNIISKEIYSCPKNADVYILDTTNENYFKVFVNGNLGYISKSMLKRKRK